MTYFISPLMLQLYRIVCFSFRTVKIETNPFFNHCFFLFMFSKVICIAISCFNLLFFKTRWVGSPIHMSFNELNFDVFLEFFHCEVRFTSSPNIMDYFHFCLVIGDFANIFHKVETIFILFNCCMIRIAYFLGT